jgi:all-trans-retinol 13,14-reductase
MAQDIDVIVIGSGIGGLACAALLARAGKRCLVLEQHYIAGGCTHACEDKGFEFDTGGWPAWPPGSTSPGALPLTPPPAAGIHYIGNVHKRQKFFDLISSTKIEWDAMGRLPHDIDEVPPAAARFALCASHPSGARAGLR